MTRDRIEHALRDLSVRSQPLRSRCRGLVQQDLGEPREDVSLENCELVIAVLRKTLLFGLLDRKSALVLVDTMAVENAHFDDRTGNPGWYAQRGIAHVRSLLAKYGAKQLFFRS